MRGYRIWLRVVICRCPSCQVIAAGGREDPYTVHHLNFVIVGEMFRRNLSSISLVVKHLSFHARLQFLHLRRCNSKLEGRFVASRIYVVG